MCSYLKQILFPQTKELGTTIVIRYPCLGELLYKGTLNQKRGELLGPRPL